MIIIPIFFTFVAFIGIVVTSAGFILYGDYIWDPLRLIDQWDNRAAAFFASFSFALATIGTNISANSISAANDFTALAPKVFIDFGLSVRAKHSLTDVTAFVSQYINIRRGQILCAIIGGWAICPWEILAHAIGFLSFMSGYTIILGPISAVMITDYWFVKKCKIDVPALYNQHGRYSYWKGIVSSFPFLSIVKFIYIYL